MLNYVWAGMLALGIITAAFTGRLPDVTDAVIASSKDAVTLCLTMLGVMSMWTGVMKIAERSGLIGALSKGLAPLLSALFPDVPKKSKAMTYIATNFIANVFGLGWAATPAGLKAMEELQHLNRNKERASRAMCMFLIVNMSSLQLVTMNIIAYRAEFGAKHPSDVIGPGILATIVTTLAGVVFAKLCEGGSQD